MQSQTEQLESLPARVLHIDEDRDLALLSTRPPQNSENRRLRTNEWPKYANGQIRSEWPIFEFGHSPILIFPFW